MSTTPQDIPSQPRLDDGPAADGSSGRQKRRRKVLSCFTCRQRKLKCDREYPSCNRCRKAGCANTCAYDVALDSNPISDDRPSPMSAAMGEPARVPATTFLRRDDFAHVPWPKEFPKRKPRFPERRPASLESRIARLERTARLSPNDSEEESQPRLGEAMLLKGKSYKTQFYGATSTWCTISNFPEIRDFMKEKVLRSPALLDLHKDLRSLIARVKKANLLQPEPAFTKVAMLGMLPAKTAMDTLALLYMDNVEIIYCILHEPSFWRDYDDFWKNPEGSDPSFLVILLLITSISCTISAKEPLRFVGKSSSARENAIRLVFVSEAWLQRQSHKHLTLALMQIQCLLVIAKQTNHIKRKRAWIAAGNLVRFGMTAGLHRDASVLDGKVAVPAQEMRKRLWGTIVELELQASYDRGMPVSSLDISSHCGPPANISDNSQQALNPRETEGWTVTSYLRFSHNTIAFRSFLNNLINEPQDEMEYEDVMRHDEQIRRYLKAIPNWQVHVNLSSEQQKRRIIQTLLDIQLRQYLIPLHSPFARHAGESPRHQYSVMVCYEAAHKILDLHSALVASGVHVLNLFRDDILGPALSTCQNVYSSALINDNLCLQSLGVAFVPDIQKALVLLEEKEKRNGSGFQQLWALSAADALVRTKLAGSQDVANGQPVKDAVARVMGISYKILASQEDPSMAMALHRLDKEPSLPPSGTQQVTEPAQLDGFEDLSAWAFDDLWNFDLTDFRLD